MKMNLKILFIAFLLSLFSCGRKPEEGVIRVEWNDNLAGDFSFIESWDYPEGVSENQFGQLVCDGICNPLLDLMCDGEGRIYDDSVSRYYQLLDTVHCYHTLSSEAQCYEWGGTDFAFAYRAGDTVKCYTAGNVATHSILWLSVVGDKCIPQIELNSITASGVQYFRCNGGYIKIDRALMRKDTLKAEFNLTFNDVSQPGQPMWWKGRIYTHLTSEKSSSAMKSGGFDY